MYIIVECAFYGQPVSPIESYLYVGFCAPLEEFIKLSRLSHTTKQKWEPFSFLFGSLFCCCCFFFFFFFVFYFVKYIRHTNNSSSLFFLFLSSSLSLSLLNLFYFDFFFTFLLFKFYFSISIRRLHLFIWHVSVFRDEQQNREWNCIYIQ